MDTMLSVMNQSYPGIEYIIVDGGSTDGTIDLVRSLGDKVSKVVSEPDEGIYDAINKGIRISTGDIVGILNSDDCFHDNKAVERVVKAFEEFSPDAVYGDVLFIDSKQPSKIRRYYSSKGFRLEKFKFGYMPAHPSFYVKRELFEKFGYYKTDYKIAADYELMLRFLLLNKIKCKYLEMPVANMRTGGVSNKSLYSRYLLNKEIYRACRENGVKTNYFFIYSKYFRKVFEFFGNN